MPLSRILSLGFVPSSEALIVSHCEGLELVDEPNATTIITLSKPLTRVRATSGTERTTHQAGCKLLKIAKP